MKRISITAIAAIALVICGAIPISAQTESGSRSLINETMLHPGDASTGYVLKKGEVSYNQSITPYPSWGWWGITDWLTAELDFECWLGGVPSFNFRFGIADQRGWLPSIAFETMYQYLKDERDQFENLDYLDVHRKGSSWYNHINMSWRINESWYIHMAGGATYAESISISNGSKYHYTGRTFIKYISPDFSVGIDYRIKDWITLHATAAYGSTFLYGDNIIRKRQFVIATRVAPFIGSDICFLNSFRVELSFLHARFVDAKESITGPIGFAYWQWML